MVEVRGSSEFGNILKLDWKDGHTVLHIHCHLIVHLNPVNFMVEKSYINKLFFKTPR